MNDPIKPIIERIRNCQQFRTARDRHFLKPNFLNQIGEIFENHGFEVARLKLLDKKGQFNTKDQAPVLLEVLQIMETSSVICQNRAIGRQIIKTLNSID